MSKSIVLVNTPGACIDCIFCQEYRTKSREYAYCYVTNGDSENDMKPIDCIYGYRNSKPDWCPLKPLPEKKEEMGMPRTPSMNDIKRIGFQKGWNACIDEIIGGNYDD